MPEPVKIKTAGAFRVRSGEAGPVEIKPFKGPCPKPSVPMPYTARELIRAYYRERGRSDA